ncbi:hypothetical protein EV361DRAFT_953463 [Lentinula raphanica]|nr:hypothetical protein EV361DRAFT_953463 [Lentinula raphanica]
MTKSFTTSETLHPAKLKVVRNRRSMGVTDATYTLTETRSNAQQASLPPPPPPPVASQAYSLPTFKPVDAPSVKLTAFSAPSPVPAAPSAGPSTQTPDFTGLLSSLLKAGVVAADPTSLAADATAHDDNAVPTSVTVDGKSILTHSMQLTAAAITKYIRSTLSSPRHTNTVNARSRPPINGSLKSEFVEDDEEWERKIAVKKDDTMSIVAVRLHLLEANLTTLYAPTWFPRKPLRGSGRRCLTLPRVINSGCLGAGVESESFLDVFLIGVSHRLLHFHLLFPMGFPDLPASSPDDSVTEKDSVRRQRVVLKSDVDGWRVRVGYLEKQMDEEQEDYTIQSSVSSSSFGSVRAVSQPRLTGHLLMDLPTPVPPALSFESGIDIPSTLTPGSRSTSLSPVPADSGKPNMASFQFPRAQTAATPSHRILKQIPRDLLYHPRYTHTSTSKGYSLRALKLSTGGAVNSSPAMTADEAICGKDFGSKSLGHVTEGKFGRRLPELQEIHLSSNDVNDTVRAVTPADTDVYTVLDLRIEAQPSSAAVPEDERPTHKVGSLGLSEASGAVNTIVKVTSPYSRYPERVTEPVRLFPCDATVSDTYAILALHDPTPSIMRNRLCGVAHFHRCNTLPIRMTDGGCQPVFNLPNIPSRFLSDRASTLRRPGHPKTSGLLPVCHSTSLNSVPDSGANLCKVSSRQPRMVAPVSVCRTCHRIKSLPLG